MPTQSSGPPLSRAQIVWATMQMTSATGWLLETRFPDPFGKFLTWCGTVIEASLPYLIPLGCVAHYGHHQHVLLMALGPLTFIVAFAASGVGFSWAGRTHASQKCYSASLLICFLMLPTTSTTLFRTFHCEELDDGRRFLLAVSRSATTHALLAFLISACRAPGLYRRL